MRLPTRREFTTLVALLLVAVPIWAPPLDVTGEDYRYAAVELSEKNGTLTVDYRDADRRMLPAIEGLDCTATDPLVQRRCLFEGGAIDGNVTGVDPDIVAVSHPSAGDELTRGTGAEYVVLGSTVYRRSTTFVSANESVGMTVELGLQRVDPETALEDVARQESGVSESAITAIREGSVRTNQPITDAGTVLAVDGDYYVVYEESSPQFLSAKPDVERTLEAVCVAAGALLLLRQDSSSSRSN